MSIVDKLLKVDSIEKQTKNIKSARLSHITGEDVEITIREISGRAFTNARNAGKGKAEPQYEQNLMVCLSGIVDPDLKDASLQEHFGVHTPKDLCEKLFSAEVYIISDHIVNLSGLNTSEEEIKN